MFTLRIGSPAGRFLAWQLHTSHPNHSFWRKYDFLKITLKAAGENWTLKGGVQKTQGVVFNMGM